MRQRSTRQKPLYLHDTLSMVGWDGEAMRPDSARLDVPSRKTRFAFDSETTFLVHYPVPSGVERATYGFKG